MIGKNKTKMPTFVDVVEFGGEVSPKTSQLVKSGEFYWN